MSDALGTLLHHVRIETVFFGRIELGAPWGARMDATDMVSLHHVVEGEMWLEMDALDVHLRGGDLLMLPHGRPHCLRHAPDASVLHQEPWMRKATHTIPSVRRRLGGSGARTVVLCATMRLSGAGRALLLRKLPAAVHLSGQAGEPVSGLDRLLDALRDEIRERRPGSLVMAARFAELLLLQSIRVELGRRSSGAAPVGDSHVQRALAGLYEAPHRTWTVASLARLAGQSRSGFARAFREQVGESPLRHLTRWRIELAKEKLSSEPDAALGDIALAVGYRSEAAFNAAFRRETGVPPGAYRRGARTA